jgi:lipoate-protein ligase A
VLKLHHGGAGSPAIQVANINLSRAGLQPLGLFMHWLDVSFSTAPENLACDEALAEQCEAGGPEVLRFWTPPATFIVAGYANKLETEVKVAACRDDGIPVYRRISGGGTVLQGPGCLNYALILRLAERSPLATVAGANHHIMEINARALSELWPQPISVKGHTDLVSGGRKFSGNAQRRYQHSLLFHGCFLRACDLSRMDRYLKIPGKQPDYRRQRPHADFVMNLPLPAAAVKAALRKAWGAHEPLETAPGERIQQLVRAKYSRADWNEKF